MRAKVLLVDDDDSIRTMTSVALESFGCTVIQGKSGEEGLALFEEHGSDFSLLISDLVMPGMSGDELIRKLLHLKPSLHYLLVSGEHLDFIQFSISYEEGKTFLRKPFSLKELLTVVRCAFGTMPPFEGNERHRQ